MDVSYLFGSWEMLLDNVLVASVVTVATPCWGFRIQHGLISSCFVDTLLLIVPHVHMCKFLGAGEEFIVRRKIFWIPEYFLVFWGLACTYIKTHLF